MRYFYRCLSFAAVITAFAALFGPEVAEARPLRVLTYNIHHALGRDGRYDVERIAGVINAANPDLVALQEVDQGTSRSGPDDMQLNLLAQLTRMTGRFGKTINRLGGEYGNAVLINPEFTLIGVTNHAMPNPADGEPRRVMEVSLRLDDEGTSRRINFFATHMDHTSGANRQAQMDFINNLVTDSNTPAILAGDFNFDQEGPAYASLLDEWVDPTAANSGRPRQIDYVTYRGGDQWSVVQQGRFIVNSTTEDASDHYPLLASLELVPHSADFNRDGDVDGADLLRWQRNLGKTGVSVMGDANHDRVVNGADRTTWAQQFGGATQSVAAIPEPTTDALFAFQMAAIVLLDSRRKTRSATASRLTRT